MKKDFSLGCVCKRNDFLQPKVLFFFFSRLNVLEEGVCGSFFL